MNEDRLSLLSLLIGVKNSSSDSVQGFLQKCKVNLPRIPSEKAASFYNDYCMRSLKDLKEIEFHAFQPAIQPAISRSSDAPEYLSPSQQNLVMSNALSKLLQSINNYNLSGVTVLINGVTLDNASHNIRKELENAKPRDSLARNLLELPDVTQSEVMSNPTFPLLDLKTILTTKSEKEAQRVIRANAVRLIATDTSGQGNESTLSLPQQMVPDGSGIAVSNIYNLSARPDLTANFGHCYMDVKVGLPDGKITHTDLSVLCQAADRVYVERNAYAPIRRSVTFAATNKKAWVVVFTREQNDSEKIDFICIHHHSVSFMWMQIWWEVQVHGLNYWFHPVGTLLVAALNALGLDYRHCFTKLIAVSSSSVFSVFTPRSFGYLSEANPTIGVSGSDVHFCMKVNMNLESFDRECDAHMAVVRSHLAENVDFYATGAFRNSTQHPHVLMVVPKKDIVSLAIAATRKALRKTALLGTLSEREPFWTQLTVDKPSELAQYSVDKKRFYTVHDGGVTVMLPGKKPRYDTLEDRVRWLSGVQRSLRLTHLAGYYHCDLRLTNILDFGSDVQIIDYDLASSANAAGVAFVRGGAQWNGAGGRIRSILDSTPVTQSTVTVKYLATDDHEMLQQSMLRFPTVVEVNRVGGRGASGAGSIGASSRSAASTDIEARGAFSYVTSGQSVPHGSSSVSTLPLHTSYINEIVKATIVEEADATSTSGPSTTTLYTFYNKTSSIAEDIATEGKVLKKRKYEEKSL